MRMYDIISAKKNKNELSREQITFFVNGVTDSTIPDYQISAFLMAVCINGMTPRETSDLALAMADSGKRADLSKIKGKAVDKHSSGGVGDKCTLVIGPVVSSFGIPFAKLSGRGLGHTGGTIDKLESVQGFRTDLSENEFSEIINKINIAVASQSENLAPADKKLYALRDVTATIDSIPLIAASIMSKKIASGAKRILLDIKCGNGAFMKKREEAKSLAMMMSEIGKLAGLKTKIFITDMNQPLGKSIGNSLEVKEAFDTLRGKGPNDLEDLCICLSAGMMELAGIGSYEECKEKAKSAIDNKNALKKFNDMISCQGGKPQGDNYPLLNDKASFVTDFTAENEGYICGFETDNIGIASLVLGAGRSKQTDKVDPGAGIVLHKKVNDYVKPGDSIATLYTSDYNKAESSREILKKSVIIGKNKVEKNKIILDIIN